MFGAKRTNRGSHLIFDAIQRPLSRVELHVHLDGSVRHETVYELAKQKNLILPGRGSYEELVDYFVVKKPKDLAAFLSRFDIIYASIKADLKALERIAYEFVEDCFNHGILYAEARFCPHIVIPDEVVARQDEAGDSETKKWVWDVTGAMIKGLQRGYREYGLQVKLIATCIRGYSKLWYDQTLQLVLDTNFHQGWIVGIDIAALPDTSSETFMLEKEAVDLFSEVRKHGVRRTIHAGESGGASQVTNAIDILHAERIGHGYRIIDDPKVYKRVKEDGIHLECCPWSSILTGSVSVSEYPHPIVSFFQDQLNVSVNTDDPTCTGTRMDDEYKLLANWGLSEAHFVRGNFNAARSCFLPENEKSDMLQTLAKNYGSTL